MRKLTLIRYLFFLSAAISLGGQPTEGPDIIGRFSVGQETQFEISPEKELLQTVNGEKLRWQTPGRNETVRQVEFVASAAGYVPYSVTEAGHLYKGDISSTSWTLVGTLPGMEGLTVVGKNQLAVDIFNVGRLYWASDRTVWSSTDAGQTWWRLYELQDQIARLVYALNQELVAITRNGLVIRGDVGEDEDGKHVWTPVTKTLPVSHGEDVLVLDEGRYVFVSEGAGQFRGTHYNGDTKRFESPDPASTRARVVEFSSANARTDCSVSVERFDPRTRRFVPDNYWDISASSQTIDIILKAPGQAGCVFFPAYDPHRVALSKTGSNTVLRWGTVQPLGTYTLSVNANQNSAPVIRGIALHVRSTGYYTNLLKCQGCAPMPASQDVWAVLVQNSSSGGQACQAIVSAPTQQEAFSQGRLFLKIAVRGSNPSCNRTSTSTIACSSPPVTRNATSFVLLPKSGVGMTECTLPDPD